jgi:hypothetical protein
MDSNRHNLWIHTAVFLILSVTFLLIDPELAHANASEIRMDDIIAGSNSSQSAIQEYVVNKITGELAVSFPHEMIIGREYIIKARLSRGNDKYTISDIVNDSNGSLYSMNIKGNLFKVELLGEGEDFAISQLSNEVKEIPNNSYAEWTWRVVPLNAGNLRLTLVTFFISYPYNGSIIESVKTVIVPTYSSSFLQQISTIILKVYYYILIIIPVFSLLIGKSVRDMVKKWRNS